MQCVTLWVCCPSPQNDLLQLNTTRSSAVAKKPRDASCLYSFNTKRRAQSFIVLASDSQPIPLRTVKFFSVLFSSAYSSMLQAVTNKHSMVRRRLCDLQVVGNCLSLRSSHVQQSIDSQWCVADCVIYTTSSSVNVFGTSHVQQSSIASC